MPATCNKMAAGDTDDDDAHDEADDGIDSGDNERRRLAARMKNKGMARNY